jgi:hypothetical protein
VSGVWADERCDDDRRGIDRSDPLPRLQIDEGDHARVAGHHGVRLRGRRGDQGREHRRRGERHAGSPAPIEAAGQSGIWSFSTVGLLTTGRARGQR